MQCVPLNRPSAPIVQWEQPEIYRRYRTQFKVNSQSLKLRLGKTLGCFCCWFLPLLALQCFLHRTVEGLVVALFAATWFAQLKWLNLHYPSTHGGISFHDEIVYWGWEKFHGKFRYGDLAAWTIVERQFEGQILHLLLARFGRGRNGEWCLPDAGTRDRVSQLLHEKMIPFVSDLKPSWEQKT